MSGSIKKGFRKGCRPLIGLDGCHLKGTFGGQLLTAVGCDSNDGMYPIAWAVVEAENSETWNWFLNLLCIDVQIINSGGWTFISDRQKVSNKYLKYIFPFIISKFYNPVLTYHYCFCMQGLINALTNVVPNAQHKFCVMHLYRNMYVNHKGIGCRALLWLAARATTEYMYSKYRA